MAGNTLPKHSDTCNPLLKRGGGTSNPDLSLAGSVTIPYGGLGEIIGPVTSAKLIADFIEWDELARSLGDAGFYQWYARMRKVFEYAGEAGAVWSEGETYR